MEIYRGIVASYDATNHKADVVLVGSMSGVVLGVPVAHHIGPELMTADAACGVVFFREGDPGVVVCTFDGTSPAWVTSALIKDGEIVKADLGWDPTVYSAFKSTSGDLTLTEAPTYYAALGQHTVTVATGKTVRVALVASVAFYCTAWTGANFDRVQLYKGGASVGQPMWARVRHQYDGSTVTLHWTGDITVDTTFKVYCWKINDLNTERADRGIFTVQYWEVPS